MVYAQTGIFLENKTHKFSLDIVIQTDHLISARKPDLLFINKKRGSCHLRAFLYSCERQSENEKKKNTKDIRILVYRLSVERFAT